MTRKRAEEGSVLAQTSLACCDDDCGDRCHDDFGAIELSGRQIHHCLMRIGSAAASKKVWGGHQQTWFTMDSTGPELPREEPLRGVSRY